MAKSSSTVSLLNQLTTQYKSEPIEEKPIVEDKVIEKESNNDFNSAKEIMYNNIAMEAPKRKCKKKNFLFTEELETALVNDAKRMGVSQNELLCGILKQWYGL